MHNTTQEMLKEFRASFDVPTWFDEKDALGRKRNTLLNLALIEEEFREVADELLDIANADGSIVKLAKELGDLVYVAYHAAVNFGIDLEAVLEAIHQSNLTKLDDDGKPVRRPSDGKILKGPNYVAPDIHQVLYGASD